MSDADDINAIIDQQLSEFGAASVQMSDGRLLVLTTATLERLLERAHEKGQDRSAIFIQTPVETAVAVPAKALLQ